MNKKTKKRKIILAIVWTVLTFGIIGFFVWIASVDQVQVPAAAVVEISPQRRQIRIETETEQKQIKIETVVEPQETKIEFETEQIQIEVIVADSSLEEDEAVFKIDIPKQVLLDVPFTPQAPFGDWDDVRQQDACEEASVLMAMRWIQGKGLTPKQAETEIIAMTEYEEEKYGHFHDTSAQDTALRLFNDYFDYDKVSVKYNINSEDIKKELANGNLVIVPANGTMLGNLYYTPPGPELHMLVIIGYDDTTGEFITNDPGTKRGKGYRYSYEILENALRDYPSGYKEPINQIQNAMIIISI